MKRLCTLPNGCNLYVKENELVGGRIYYSGENSVIHEVWDTASTDLSTLMVAIEYEVREREKENK